jgi:hypothetical protein
MEKFLSFLFLLTSIALPQVAQAGRVEPESINCWFYKGSTIALKNSCTYESHSWTGGWNAQLTWEDGVRNTITYGKQGRGDYSACPSDEQYAIDGTCGQVYYRNPRTLKRISSRQISNHQSVVTCVQLKQKSVCWQR